MQPPHDTHAFPAHDPGAPHPHGPGTGPGSAGSADSGAAPAVGDAPAPSRRRMGLGAKIGIGLVAVLALLGIGAVAAEFGLRASIADRVEKDASASLGSPAKVDLGSGLVLPSFLSGTLDEIHITAPGAESRPDGGFAPAIDLTAHGARSEGEATRVDSLDGVVTVFDAQLGAAARSRTDSSSPISSFVSVQNVRSDPASGRLLADIGGLAQIAVRPVLKDGTVSLVPEEAKIMGIPIPDGILGGAMSLMDDATGALPEGITITGVHVVEGGLRLDIAGRDVLLEQK